MSAVGQISIVSFNVRGLRNRVKRRTIFRHFRIYYPHSIAIIQETHSRPSMVHSWSCEWAGSIYFSHGTESGQGGVAILFPSQFPHCTSEIETDEEGRIVCAKVGLDSNPIIIIGVYAPAADNQTDKCNFLNKIRDMLNCFGNHNTFLVGDFNIRLQPIDSDNDNMLINRASTKLRNLLDEFSLEDSWRYQHPKTRKYTWRRLNPLQQSRIDYIFTSLSLLLNNPVKTKIEAGISSDHNFVFIDVELNSDRRGPGLWVYNNTLLNDELHIEAVRNEIQKANNRIDVYSGNVALGTNVEMLLSRIRVLAMKRGKEIAQELRREENAAYNRLSKLEHIMANAPSEDHIAEYGEARKKLDDIKEKRGQAAILRSQVTWMEEGEKPTKYFFRIAKNRAAQKTISILEKDNGDFIRGNKEILQFCADHYKYLYSSKRNTPGNFQTFALGENAPRLSEEDKLSCEGPITKQECKNAISSMARNKTAGISGFTAEFFSFFWEDIGDVIVNYFNNARDEGQLFVSHRRGIITLIPKKGNQMQLRNKRPICLLDVLYKLIAKVIAIRLSKVIDKIINKNQTGFVKGRYIGETLRVISDVLDYCKMDNLQGILLAIDYKNAFDSLEHDFMFFALETFNFGHNFISWVRLLYGGALLTIKNNGFTSEWFPCSRGTFQGSPLSGLLFIIAVELFANRVRERDDIKGIMINNTEVKISQYADDTTLFLDDQLSVERIVTLLNEFREVSGLDINLRKSNIMWLGSFKNRRDSLNGIEAVAKIKILGLWFSATENCNEDNISPVIKRIQNVTNAWSERSLTIKGRIVVAKSLLMSQLVYIVSCCTIENIDLKQIQSHIMKFIWRGRPPKVSRITLCQSIKNGGLKCIEVDKWYTAIRMTWIKRIINNVDSTWRILLQSRMNGFDLNDVVRISNSSILLNRLRIPTFYREVISSFQKLCKVPIDNTVKVRAQILWHNDDLKINNQPIVIHALYRKGIKRIDDITDMRGNIMNIEQIRQKYTNISIDFLTLQSIKSAIPSEWKQLLRQNPRALLSEEEKSEVMVQINDDKIIPVKHSRCQHFYGRLVESVDHVPSAIVKWGSYGIQPCSWQKIFQIPYNCTISTRLQSLHYRIVHRYIPTRKYLCTRGVIGTALCRKCFAVDDLKHFFYECPDIKPIWERIIPQLTDIYHLPPEFASYEAVLLGFPAAPPVVNLIILLIKQHVVSCKLSIDENVSEPQLTSIFRIITRFAKAEFLVAKKKSKIEKYYQKWGAILNPQGNLLLQ